MAMLAAIAALFRFHAQYAVRLGRSDLQGWMPMGRERAGRVVRLGGALARDFNRDIDALAEVTRRCRAASLSYEAILRGCHIVRCVACAGAFVLPPSLTLLLAAIQFLVAPLSFPIAVMKLLTYGPVGLLHVALTAVVSSLSGWAEHPPASTWICFTIDGWFLLCFLLLDQAVNLIVYLLWSESFEMPTLVKHIAFGTANTKLYYVVVFGCLRGVQVNMATCVIVSLATEVLLPCLGKLCSSFPGRDVSFYLDHRLGHLPVVYQHAHKAHHQLNDTTPWDAHTYGNGMNEHYFLMVMDVLPTLLFPHMICVPHCFNFHLLYISWANKPHHTRLKHGTPYDYFFNFHADHHKVHNRNYALMNGALLDFYFGTQASECAGTNGVLMQREVEESSGDVLIRVQAAS